jgi:Demerecviridae HNH endonuclease
MLVTHERLTELLSFNPEDGIFRWRISQGKAAAGSIAGWRDKDGYRIITITTDRRRNYRASRLAWFWVHRRWPAVAIDHIDLDKTNDRIGNLREATHSQNSCNRTALPKSVAKCVYPTRSGKFLAVIGFRRKRTHLGVFPTKEEAMRAYREAAARLHGEFARAE